jgi:hypothetical protein
VSHPLSQAALMALTQEIVGYAHKHGFRLVASVELIPEDPDCAYSVTVISPQGEWTAKFMGKNQLAALSGALFHVKSILFGSFKDQTNLPQEPCEE